MAANPSAGSGNNVPCQAMKQHASERIGIFAGCQSAGPEMLGKEEPELGTRSLFPGSLSVHFISMDHYRSSAHLANFQVRSLLNRSQKNQWFALGKER